MEDKLNKENNIQKEPKQIILKRLNNRQLKEIHSQLIHLFNFNKTILKLKLINKLYGQYQKKLHYNNIVNTLEIAKDLFDKESTYLTFIERNKPRLFGNFLNAEISIFLIDEFERIYINQTKRQQSQEEQEDNVEDDIDNIISLDKYLLVIDTKIKTKKIILNEEQIKILQRYHDYMIATQTTNKSLFIADKHIEMKDINVLNNKYEEWEILPNILFKTKKFKDENDIRHYSNNKSLIKTTIKIKRKVSMEKFVTKYKYTCPCSQTLEFLPYKLSGEIFHEECPALPKANGDGFKKQKINRNKYKIINHMELHVYEAKISDEKIDSIYVYTTDENLKYGNYEVEMIYEHAEFEHGKNPRMIYFLINAVEKKPIQNIEKFIIPGQGKEMEQRLLLPRMKIHDVIIAIRDIYEKYTDEKITDEGMFLQIAVTLSAIMKHIFNNRYYAISVMGNKSLSKTFPATRFARMLDLNYIFSQSSTDISSAGFKGGIGFVNMNGTQVKTFEHGLVTSAGLIVFDEAIKFFTDPLLGEAIKSLFEPFVNISKIGGEVVTQNYTPILLSNFPEFALEYQKAVKDVYIDLRKQSGLQITKLDIAEDLKNINYYLQLSYYKILYKNTTLMNAIAYVRNDYENKNIDWRTGARTEVMNRILFDVVVYNQEDFVDKDNFDVDYTNLKQPLPQYLPIQEFLDELKTTFDMDINLGDIKQNTYKNKQKIFSIRKKITEWLRSSDGKDLFLYLSKGKRKIDSKINALVYDIITAVQLIESPESNVLSDNVKMWCKIFLMKIKRGISKDEYNFKYHTTKYEEESTNIETVDVTIHDAKEDRIIREAKKQIHEEEDNDDVTAWLKKI